MVTAVVVKPGRIFLRQLSPYWQKLRGDTTLCISMQWPRKTLHSGTVFYKIGMVLHLWSQAMPQVSMYILMQLGTLAVGQRHRLIDDYRFNGQTPGVRSASQPRRWHQLWWLLRHGAGPGIAVMSSSIAITRQWWQLFRGSPQGMPCYSISCAACTSTLPFSSFRIVLITSGGVQCCRRCIIEGQYVTVSFSFPTGCPLYSVSGGNAAAVAPWGSRDWIRQFKATLWPHSPLVLCTHIGLPSTPTQHFATVLAFCPHFLLLSHSWLSLRHS